MSSILVTNIDDKVSEFHLRELFEAFGAIEKVTMAQTQVGPQCTIQYAAAEDARKALFFTGTNLGSRAIIVTPIAVKPPPIPLTGRGPTLAMSQAQITAASQGMTPEQQLESILGTAHSSAEQVARTVYLGNLAKAATEEDVARHFQTCGPIVYIKMGGIDAKSSVSRDNKFAFIEFLVRVAPLCPVNAIIVFHSKIPLTLNPTFTNHIRFESDDSSKVAMWSSQFDFGQHKTYSSRCL